VTLSPEAAPSATDGGHLTLTATGADCTYPPSVDGTGRPVTYGPEMAVDDALDTAWRCPGAGGHTIQFQTGRGVLLSDIGIVPGYAKVDPATGVNRFTDNHTVTQVTWRFSGVDGDFQFTQDIPNPVPQIVWLHLSHPVSVGQGSLTVTGTGNPGSRQDSTPISTIAVWGDYVTQGD
jgi:hypothetical protein